MGIPDHLTCLQRNLYAGQEATVRNVWNNSPEQQTGKTVWKDSLEQQTGSKSEKEHNKAVYCHPAYFAYKSSEMPGQMKHKLESRLLGEVSITSEMQIAPP